MDLFVREPVLDPELIKSLLPLLSRFWVSLLLFVRLGLPFVRSVFCWLLLACAVVNLLLCCWSCHLYRFFGFLLPWSLLLRIV
jgi:hypothetical protein